MKRDIESALYVVTAVLAIIVLSMTIGILAKDLFTKADAATPQTTFIMVPAQVDGYDTISLLHYVASLKAQNDARTAVTPTKQELALQYEKAHAKPNCAVLTKGMPTVNAALTCKAYNAAYTNAENAYILSHSK